MTTHVRDLDDRLRRTINWAKAGGVTPAEITTELNAMLTALTGDSSTHDITVTTPPAGLAPASPPSKGVPAVTAPPTISGTVSVGQALTCSNGTWTNSPTSYSYQWMRSGIGAIAGATTASYTIVSADTGNRLSCRVRAVNAAGAAGQTNSNTVGPV